MIVTKIISKLNTSTSGVITVGIAGGSGSGKSFTSKKIGNLLKKNRIDVAIINQDDFSIGKNFKGKHTSKYKWDDPDNYRIDECVIALKKLIDGESVDILAYTLKDHMPSAQKTVEFKNNNLRRVIIIEGIFAWYGKLESLVDYKIFLDVDFFRRFILRLNRNVNEIKNTDFNTVVSQYFGSVARADIDIISPMKHSADKVIKRKVDFNDLGKYLIKSNKVNNAYNSLFPIYRDVDSSIIVYTDLGSMYMRVDIYGDTLFDEKLTIDNIELLKNENIINFSAVS